MSVIRLRTSTVARKCEVHDILLERGTSLRFTLEDIHTLRSGVCVYVSVTYRELQSPFSTNMLCRQRLKHLTFASSTYSLHISFFYGMLSERFGSLSCSI